MIPLELKLTGIGPHSETCINFNELPSLLALTGDVGAGKTHLAEAVYFTLYGKSVFYAGRSLYDMLTQNGTGEGQYDLTFKHAWGTYRAVRTIRDTGKTKTHEAILYREGEMIAGPKVGDFDREVVALLGDARVAAATWMMGQGAAGDLCAESQPAKRRELFTRLLQMDHLDAIEKRAADAALTLTGQLRELEAQLAGEPDYEDLIEEETQASNDDSVYLEGLRLTLKRAESELEAARCRLRDAQGGDDVLQAQVDAHEQAVKAVEAERTRMTALEAEVKTLAARASGLQEAREQSKAHKEAMTRREALTGQETRFKKWREWEDWRKRCEDVIRNLERRIADLEATPGADPATKELAGRLDEITIKGQQAKSENYGREMRNSERQRRREETRGFISVIHGRMGEIEKRLESRPVTPFGDKCAPCPLMKEYAGLPSEFKRYQEKLDLNVSRLEQIEPDEPLIDLAELRAEYERAAAAKKTVDIAAHTALALADLRVDLKREQAALERHTDAEPERMDDPTEALRTVRAMIDRLAGADERVKACEQAVVDHDRKHDDLQLAKGHLQGAIDATECLAPAAESARAALLDRDNQRQQLSDDVFGAESDVIKAREGIDTLTKSIAGHEARIEDLQTRREEGKDRRERARRMRTDLDALKDVRACFGAKGVRQILIDQAAPELEGIADGLFERATAGRMRLRIATQRALDDGSLVEHFGIMIRDARGERDVLEFSGGERQIVQFIFRLAVATWVARMNGTTIDTLILDEPFTAMGETSEVLDDFLGILETLSKDIKRVVLVTHIRALSDRMRGQIRLSKGLSGVRVEIVDLGVAA